MGMLSFMFASLVAAQGQALRLEYPHEPQLEAVSVTWGEREIPLVRQGAGWMTVLGIDLDAPPGIHDARVELSYEDGRRAVQSEVVEVTPVSFPTTELTVEPRFV